MNCSFPIIKLKLGRFILPASIKKAQSSIMHWNWLIFVVHFKVTAIQDWVSHYFTFNMFFSLLSRTWPFPSSLSLFFLHWQALINSTAPSMSCHPVLLLLSLLHSLAPSFLSLIHSSSRTSQIDFCCSAMEPHQVTDWVFHLPNPSGHLYFPPVLWFSCWQPILLYGLLVFFFIVFLFCCFVFLLL